MTTRPPRLGPDFLLPWQKKSGKGRTGANPAHGRDIELVAAIAVAVAAAVAPLEAAIQAMHSEMRAAFPARKLAGAELALLRVLARTALGSRFTSPEAYRVARDVTELREALAAAFVENPRGLGMLLRKYQGKCMEGLTIEKTDEYDREGAVWCVRESCESESR